MPSQLVHPVTREFLATERIPAAGTWTVTRASTLYLVTTSGGPQTINLPTLGEGEAIVFQDDSGNAATNNITLQIAGGSTIDGAASLVLDVDGEIAALVRDGEGGGAGTINYRRVIPVRLFEDEEPRVPMVGSEELQGAIPAGAAPGLPLNSLQYAATATTFGGCPLWLRNGNGIEGIGAGAYWGVGVTSAIASQGGGRLGNDVAIYARDQLNTGDRRLIRLDSSNRIELGEFAAQRTQVLLGLDASMYVASGEISMTTGSAQPHTYNVAGSEVFRLSATGQPTSIDPSTNGLRLTLTTAVPVTRTDVTGAGTLYFTPYDSGAISLFDGTRWLRYLTAEISITAAGAGLAADSNYDVFAYWTGSAVALEFSAAWASATARTDAIAFQNGVPVKSGATTRRLVGTIRTSAAAAFEDTTAQRYVMNWSNRVPRQMSRIDNTNTWSYVNPNSVWRQARATAANRVEYVTGDAGLMVECNVHGLGACSAGTSQSATGVGVDSTTVNSAQTYGSDVDSLSTRSLPARYVGQPGLGYHALNWLEVGASGALTYSYAGDGGTTVQQTGMIAWAIM